MPVLTTLAAFASGTVDGAGSTSTTRQVQAETTALASGVPYLVLYDGGCYRDGSSGTDTLIECDVRFGATVHAHAQAANDVPYDPPEAGTNLARCCGFTVVVGTGSDTVSMGTRRISGTSAGVLWSGGGVKCIPVDSLTENTHYWQSLGANSDTAVVTPAAGAGWVAFGTPVTFTAGNTGNFMAHFAGEAQFQSDANANDAIRVRYRMTTDPSGSPVTVTLGAGASGGELSPALHLVAPASDPDQFVRHFGFAEVVALVSGTEYTFFMEVDSPAGGGNTEYRRPRALVFDGAVWAGGFTQITSVVGNQPANGTPVTTGPLTISDPSPDTHEYTFLAGSSFMNLGSWHRAYMDLDGTRFPDPGGFGSGGYSNGPGLTNDFHWLTGLAEASVSAAYDVSFSVVADYGGADSPSGYQHGETGADPGDPTILARVIAWRMETTTSPATGITLTPSASEVQAALGTAAVGLGAVAAAPVGLGWRATFGAVVVALGATVATPAAQVGQWTSAAPSVALGATVASPTAQVARWTSVSPSVALGATVASPTAQVAQWAVPSAQVALGPTVLTPSAAAVWAQVGTAVAALEGAAVTLTPAAFAGVWVVPSAAVLLAGTVAPVAAVGYWAVGAPAVVVAPVVVAPTSIGAQFYAAGPTVEGRLDPAAITGLFADSAAVVLIGAVTASPPSVRARYVLGAATVLGGTRGLQSPLRVTVLESSVYAVTVLESSVYAITVYDS